MYLINEPDYKLTATIHVGLDVTIGIEVNRQELLFIRLPDDLDLDCIDWDAVKTYAEAVSVDGCFSSTVYSPRTINYQTVIGELECDTLYLCQQKITWANT